MDLIVKNFFKFEQKSKKKKKDEIVLKVPFLKLYMDNNSNQINNTNQTLTAQQ